MRVAILGAANIRHMSLLSHYLNHVDLNINGVDIIYTGKYDIEENIQGINNYYEYKVDIKEDWTFIKKAIAYYRFRPYAMKILRENHCDLVIVWGSYTEHLFRNFLEKHYKNKFILNIRDYLFESDKLIKYRMKKTVDASRLTTLSLEGFLKFLPKSEKYRIIYSYNMGIIRESNVTGEFKKRWSVNIGFISNVRFNEINQKLIKELANDSRFHMQYSGTGSEKLEVSARENFINNITFSGGFNLEETLKCLNETNILNNLFGNKNITLGAALSIRMYYALFLDRPIITTDDTFTVTEANRFGLGFGVNPENLKGTSDELMDWYNNLNAADISHRKEAHRNDIIESNKQFYQEIGRIFNE